MTSLSTYMYVDSGGEASPIERTSLRLFSCTLDQEIFTLKIIHVKNFRVIKFLQFCSIRKIVLTVDNCNMDKLLESSWR